jgi:hypothetical protein
VDESILNSVKQALGLEPDYTEFDMTIIMFINSAFGDLNQIGLGPEDGFAISSSTETWGAFLGADKRLMAVQQLVYMMVRIVFDPPATAHLLASMKEMIQEKQWRLNVVREEVTAGRIISVGILNGGAP